ncbi:hypothetical protein A2U01_0086519, partial [Trifolium medium]|nr:hypothetical protein [Trifolium medium]
RDDRSFFATDFLRIFGLVKGMELRGIALITSFCVDGAAFVLLGEDLTESDMIVK